MINAIAVWSCMKNNWDNLSENVPQGIKEWEGVNLITQNPSGSVVVGHAKSDAFEGQGDGMSFAVIGLCMAGGGHVRREDEHGVLSDIWHPGRVGFVLPSTSVQGCSPAMSMLAVAFDLNIIPECYGDGINITDLSRAANRLHDDPIMTSALIAMMRNAEAHGDSSAFFDHGLALVLQRLAAQAREDFQASPKQGLSHLLTSVVEQIEARLDEDLRVCEFSEQTGLSPRTFTRLFKRELGQTPYQYITSRRIKRAKQLLSQGESVTDTALSIGFSNPAKFAATFRRWANASPSQWQSMNCH